jgi:hypothetical protein
MPELFCSIYQKCDLETYLLRRAVVRITHLLPGRPDVGARPVRVSMYILINFIKKILVVYEAYQSSDSHQRTVHKTESYLHCPGR